MKTLADSESGEVPLSASQMQLAALTYRRWGRKLSQALFIKISLGRTF